MSVRLSRRPPSSSRDSLNTTAAIIIVIINGTGCMARCRQYIRYVYVLKLIHTATPPDTTKLSCLCSVRIGGVNLIRYYSRLSPTENLKYERVNSN